MKRVNALFLLKLSIKIIVITLTMASCQRTSSDMWEDSKTAGRYMGRGMRSIAGKHGDSRQISSREEFGLASNDQNDYIPMDGEYNNSLGMGERETFNQSKYNPGDPGSRIPGIDAFQDPSCDAELARIFRNLHFGYDSSLLKGEENIAIAKNISNYLKTHPNTYIFVEGHCDERGPQSYNFSLGTNRSNIVRNFLIKEGVNGDNIFTISYGKERPLVEGDGEISWKENRRAQFKVYTR